MLHNQLNKKTFLDLRYNDFFTIVAIGRTSKKCTLAKLVYSNKPHLNGWMGLDQLQYNVDAKQYLPKIN